ncbi:ppGpp synthetase/RelA/SpoT-type nucleotidyltransferase [Rhizobium mesoamericanum]|uniref:GTP pyrophosphokinase n=1 Tax=Rhizobium mesoamericanum TaxID=1079800 RepID=UPI002787BF83|nr:RelA/SpoT domain-containing protein [Rhizobium mesoamericanum]MDQ0561182.1 ppGpp synthetase/RelA/SpoT-type nucleotidyltransferase [Rhizobium mesoamericanum]
MTAEAQYRARYETVLFPIADKLANLLQDIFAGQPRIDRISTRPKSVERFMGKAAAEKDGKAKYDDPLHQIQDQIGARIITFYKDDVHRISEEVQRYFHAIESKDMLPENEWEFGYFGNHHILMLQQDLIDPSFDKNLVPYCFELQIKTLFQHAWSEANHDLGYKPGQQPLASDELRQLAFTSAQAWGADRVFNDLFVKRSAQH